LTAMPFPHHHVNPTLVPYDLRRRYSVEEFARLPEDNTFRYELQDGVITVSPRPSNLHMKVLLRLGTQIDRQLPPGLDVLPEVEVDLRPAWPKVRVPDLVVMRSDLNRRGPNPASDVLLAIEILSPGNRESDMLDKQVEYADAGIQNLWIVDPRPPVTATVYMVCLGDFEENQRCEHTFEVDRPCPLTIDLDALLPD
jgi:Uma2 family endonuclease